MKKNQLKRKADDSTFGFFLKLFRIMKISVLLFLLGIATAFASESYSQTTKLTLAMNNATVEEVLNRIEGQSEFYFLYNHQLVDVNRRVDIDVKNVKIKNILNRLFAGTDVRYVVLGRQIILMPEKVLKEDITSNLKTQQGITVTGKVTDEKGEPLPGVNIIIKGTTQGTITDADGKYSLSVPANATLVFSFVGYKSKEIALAGKTVINVKMVPEAIGLQEVVTVGYGTRKKENLTGSVVNVSNKVIEKSPAISVTNAISGLMPGVIALNRSGEPGKDISEILIRGMNTTGSNAPLVVVDGVQNPPGWERINPENIKSISVLKDASAAIYGARAANGVILITTKRGFVGKPVISYTVNLGATQPTKIPKLAGSGLFAETVNQLLEESGQAPRFTDEEIKKYYAGNDPDYPSYNWYNEILKKNTFQQSHNFSIRGGNETVQFSFASSFANQNSIFKTGIHDYKGYTIQTTIDASITKRLKAHLDLNAGWDIRISPGASANPFYWFAAEPMMPVYWPNGYPSSGVADGYNPAMMVSDAAGKREYNENRLTTKIGFDYELPGVRGLKLDGYFIYVNNNTIDRFWQTPWTTYSYDKENDKYYEVPGGRLPAPQLSETYNFSKSPFYNLRLSYSRNFGNHTINAFIAGEQQTTSWHNVMAARSNYSSKLLPELFSGDPNTQANTGSSDKSARQSLFGRISYGYKEKYLVDFNARYDGSSAFPPGKQFGFFPGGSVAWIISKENFLSNFNAISLLKLRASIGQIGNDIIAPYQYLTAYTMRIDHGYLFGENFTKQQGLYKIVEANPDITWEVATTKNIGLDMSLWQNTFSFSVDVFKQKRNNILAKPNMSIPVFPYLEIPDKNIGVMQNSGIDLSVTGRNKPKVSGFRYSITGNLGYNKSKIINIDEAPNIPKYQKKEGHIIGAGTYYHALGIIRTEDQLNSLPVYPGTKVGDLYYEDVNGDGEISAADKMTMDKSPIPMLTFGLNFTLSYKNFSLFGNFAGQGKAWMFFYRNMRTGGWNTLEELLANRYTPGSMDSKYPNLPQNASPGADVSGLYSDFWLQNVSYVRLKTLELGYDFPEKLLTAIKLKSLRLYLNGVNLLTITKSDWFDPESNSMRGINYPQNRVFNLGVRVSF